MMSVEFLNVYEHQEFLGPNRSASVVLPSKRSDAAQGMRGGSKDASRKPPRMLGAQKHQEAPGRLGRSKSVNV